MARSERTVTVPGRSVPGKEEDMRAKIAFLVCLFVVLAGYAVSSKVGDSVLEPPKITITPPAPELAPRVAAFSGVWVATHTGVGPSRVIVERINETWASTLQFWPSDSKGASDGIWRRVRARVHPSGELRGGYPTTFSLRMVEDGTTLECIIQRAAAKATTFLKKVGAS